MDINYLLKREQISLMRAQAARGAEARAAHQGLARAYGLRLRQIAFPGAAVPATPSERDGDAGTGGRHP